MDKYAVRKNNNGGPGWLVMDIDTGRSIAWVYDQALGREYPAEDERRAELFAEVLNKGAQ